MERYSGTQAMEGAAAADPVAEWTAPSGETGLEGEQRGTFLYAF